jgi:hypothetical protein
MTHILTRRLAPQNTYSTYFIKQAHIYVHHVSRISDENVTDKGKMKYIIKIIICLKARLRRYESRHSYLTLLLPLNERPIFLALSAPNTVDADVLGNVAN